MSRVSSTIAFLAGSPPAKTDFQVESCIATRGAVLSRRRRLSRPVEWQAARTAEGELKRDLTHAGNAHIKLRNPSSRWPAVGSRYPCKTSPPMCSLAKSRLVYQTEPLSAARRCAARLRANNAGDVQAEVVVE